MYITSVKALEEMLKSDGTKGRRLPENMAREALENARKQQHTESCGSNVTRRKAIPY